MNDRKFIEIVDELKRCLIDEIEDLVPDELEGKKMIIDMALKQVSKFYGNKL